MNSLDNAGDLATVLSLLQDASASRESASAACAACANTVARAWAPLMSVAQRQQCWVPVFVAAGPSLFVPALCDALAASACPEEGALLSDAFAQALQQSTPEALFELAVEGQMLCALPDRCANAAQHLLPPFFEQGPFFAWLSRQATIALLAARHSQNLMQTFNRGCVLGHARAVARAWSQLSEQQLAEVIAPCIVAMPHGAKLVPEMLSCFSVPRFFAVAVPLLSDAALCHVLECGLLAMRTLPTQQVRLLVAVHCMRGADAAQRVAEGLARIWSDSYFARHADAALQLQVTRAIKHLLESCGSAAIQAAMPSLLAGVQERLSLPESERRRMGMALAEFASRSMEGVEPLKFEQEGLAELLEWDKDEELPLREDMELEEQKEKRLAVALDPDARIERIGNDDDDDDDSLSSYEMEEEASGKGTARNRGPAYLRDCLRCILEGKQKADQMELGLNAAEELIRSQPSDLEDVCIPLASALLHASDEFSLPDFERLKMNALVALLVAAPKRVAEFLGLHFCSPNWSIQQRVDMLDAAHHAALELSGHQQEQQQQLPVSKNLLLSAVSDDGKTRRWGNALRPASRLAGKSRLTVALGGSFFWAFQNALQSSFVAKLDPLVLAKLLLYLGKIVSLAPSSEPKLRMLTALAEGVWVHRWHKQAHVARSCMIALAEALLSLQPETLVTQFGDTVTEAINWLTDAAREGMDRETTEVAQACASELARHLSATRLENETNP